jgi:hypothetical protein
VPIRTGADYIKALQDGREIWDAGRRIEDVTKHSGFTGTIKPSPTCTTSNTSLNTAISLTRRIPGNVPFDQTSPVTKTRYCGDQLLNPERRRLGLERLGDRPAD